MNKNKELVHIRGIGKYLPEGVLTNEDLEKMVDTSDEWITNRTGIKERRIAEESVASSDMGYRAANAAIKDAGLNPAEIDMVIVATVTPDMKFPSTACIIQKKLNIGPVPCFDMGAACSGYIYAMAMGEQFIKSGKYENVLIVATEKLSSITDWEDRNTCVLFGDGAGACVLSFSNNENSGLVSSYLKADGSLGNLLNVPAGGSKLPVTHEILKKRLHYLKMEGRELFKVAIKRMAEAVKEALDEAGYSYEDIDWVIPHQANIRILKTVGKAIKVPLEKFFINIEKYGNMSSASTAIAFTEAVKGRYIKKGDIVVLVAFGGGLVWGANVIKW